MGTRSSGPRHGPRVGSPRGFEVREPTVTANPGGRYARRTRRAGFGRPRRPASPVQRALGVILERSSPPPRPPRREHPRKSSATTPRRSSTRPSRPGRRVGPRTQPAPGATGRVRSRTAPGSRRSGPGGNRAAGPGPRASRRAPGAPPGGIPWSEAREPGGRSPRAAKSGEIVSSREPGFAGFPCIFAWSQGVGPERRVRPGLPASRTGLG